MSVHASEHVYSVLRVMAVCVSLCLSIFAASKKVKFSQAAARQDRTTQHWRAILIWGYQHWRAILI